MKNNIFLDTGILGLYLNKEEKVVNIIKSQKKELFNFISSELNLIELFNHLCIEKGIEEAKAIVQNLRNSDIINCIPIDQHITETAGILKCQHRNLSIVDAVICAEALDRNCFIYTTETHFNEIKNLKVKKFDF